jgi:hypothetical protein
MVDVFGALMGTLEWLGAPEWFPATVVTLQRAGVDEWSLLIKVASGAAIPLRATGVKEIWDKKPIGMVVECIALVTDGSARWIELRSYEDDDSDIGFEGPNVRLELERYNTGGPTRG